MGLLVRFFLCIAFAALTLYKSIDDQNDLTELQLAIPSLEKEVQDIREKNLELQYEIERFESPLHLMELARQPEYGHLKSPSINEIVILRSP